MSRGDPLKPSRNSAMFGAAALDRGGSTRWEQGDVLEYNSGTHTCSVRTHSGRPLNDVPQMKPSSGEYSHLRTGTTVIISYDLGFPLIVGTIDMVGPPQVALDSPTLTGVGGVGADNPLQPTQGTNNYRPPGAPTDMTQGDWARVGSMGNHVAVLEGGISSIGSPTALMRSLGLAGLMQTIAQRMQTVTDFGEWSVENNQGRTSFIFRAGSNQATQSGLDEGHWTIRMDVGATGDLFDFQITEPQGNSLFKMHVGPDGRLEMFSKAGIDMSSGATLQQNIAAQREVTVGADDTLAVSGSRDVQVGKSMTENVMTDLSTAVGNDEARLVNNNQSTSVGGKRTEVIAGGAAKDAKAGNVAVNTKIVNGGWMVDIGNPKDGANIGAQAAFKMKTSLGNIEFDSGGGMSLKAKQLMALEAQIVKLNGEVYSLLKTEDFLRDLGQFLLQLTTALSAAVIGTPGTPSIPAISGIMATLQQFIQKCTSTTPYTSTKVKNG